VYAGEELELDVRFSEDSAVLQVFVNRKGDNSAKLSALEIK
tara:strand:+ start:996 stop:1118 length:123 start_codon:yes stop_codon:yes gene_type:complete